MNEMRIYVASLSDYNDGRLEGKWLDLSDYSNASELMVAIQEMLDDLTKKYKKIDGEVREEWAVHDYEGIPSTLASEYMGEQDFQQLYDIAEVAEERGIPVEVLVERAGDTGSDDYQALADSLMFVVDGNDESDIVHEYEDQIGGLGNEFWSNHIYIDDVTERVIYGEDVDRFREDILSENPDMDEDEAERQAEEMADEEAERREDLTTYLEDMGYGDEIPSFVSKDYEGAWKRSLSYDLDVIHHDGEMYVFSNNYGIGGTILSGMVGAYIGYKIGRARPQKIGFGTEIRIGNSVKDKIKSKIAEKRASKKKKMARGGKTPIAFKGFTINYIGGEYRAEAYGNPQFSNKNLVKLKQEINTYLRGGKYAKGGGVYSSDDMYQLNVLNSSNEVLATKRFRAKNQKEAVEFALEEYEFPMIAKFGSNIRFKVTLAKPIMARGGNVNTGRSWHQDRRMHNKSESYEKPMNSRKRMFEDGGVIGQEIVFDDNGEENTGVIKDIHEVTGNYIVTTDDGRVVALQNDIDVISLGRMREKPKSENKKRFGFFEDGGGISGLNDLIRG